MPEGKTGSRQERIAAAYDHLAANGLSGDRDDLTIARAAPAIGAARSQFYRQWTSSAGFAEDVIAHQAMPRDAWQHTFIDGWHAGPLRDPLTAAIRADAGDAVLRSALSVRPHGSPARARVASWERAWLETFADRLRATYGHGSDAPWTDVAVSLTALVEGMFLLRRMLAGSPVATSDEDTVELVVATAERMAVYLGEHMRGDAGPLAVPDGEPAVEPIPSGARRLLARTSQALRDGSLSRDATDRRLVDMAALARKLGVSSRSLYAIWPTATDLNADLFGEGVRRVRLGIANIGLETFMNSTGGDYNYFTPLLLHINQQVLTESVFPDSRPFIAMIELATNPDVLAHHGATIHEWFVEGQMYAAALLQASGRVALPGFSLVDHTWLAVAIELGAWRMVAMHGSLMNRTVTYLGHEVAALAAGIDAHTEVWCTHEAVQPDERSEPPIPPLLDGRTAPVRAPGASPTLAPNRSRSED